MQALNDVHEQRSHRDIKAGNVMVSAWDSPNHLKLHLIDWANSRLHDEGHPTILLLLVKQPETLER